MSEQYEVSIGGLISAIKRSWLKLLVFSLAIAALTLVIILQLTPRFMSEARVLVSPIASFQNPASDRLGSQNQSIDQATILSQIQVIQSRDIIGNVIKSLKLMEDEAFQTYVADQSNGFLTAILPFNLVSRYQDKPEQTKFELTIDVITKNIQVASLSESRVIGLRYHSYDPALAARISNGLAESYIEWQRSETVQQNQDDSIRLSRLISDLKAEVEKSEAEVADYRAKKGIYKTNRNEGTLNRQQLTELNSRIITARERRAESEIRAKLIRDMLKRDGEVSNAPETMRSPLLQRLSEQKTTVKRSLSELSATLLPSHPRIQQLRSELRGIDSQIRQEMLRIVSSMENDAIIARAREKALVQSLDDLKNQTVQTDGDEIQLRALEREARTNRELLNTYLARYREAAARKESAIAPAYATIVSKAHVPSSPYFPKVIPLTMLAFLATFLVGLAIVSIQAVLSGGAYAGVDRRKPGQPEPHPVFYEIDQK